MDRRTIATRLLLAFCAASSLYAQADSSTGLTVELTNPSNRVLLRPGSDLAITGTIRSTAPIARIEYLVNGFVVGTGMPTPGGSYSFTFREVPAGVYEVTARATGSTGSHAASVPALVLVQDSATPPETEELEGTFAVSVEDRFDERLAEYHYSLITSTGPVELVLPSPETGNRLPPGSIVKVRGYRTGGKLMVPSGFSGGGPRETSLVSPPPERNADGFTILQAAPPATRFGTTGVRNVLVVLMNFLDDQSTPVDIPTVKSVVLDLVNRYFQEASYGQLSLTGDVTGYITLPTPEACGVYDKVLKFAIPMVSIKFDLSKYQNLVFVGPGPKIDCGTEGEASIGDEPTLGRGLAVVQILLNNSDKPQASLVAHELGHTFGLRHANALDCGNISYDPTAACKNLEYGDNFDVMGRGSGSFVSVAHFNSVLKEVLGWLTPTPVTTTGVYNLGPLESRESEIKALKISPVPPNDSFYIEYRQPIGFDAPYFMSSFATSINGPRILLEGNPSHQLNMHPPSDNTDRDDLKAGERYIDYAKRFSITAVTATTSAQMRVLIAPLNAPTAIFISPSNNTVVTGMAPVSVDALDRSGISKVELYRDGTLLGMQAAEPYSFPWDTSQEASGPHVLTAKAYNRSQATFSASINVTVRRPPKVSITSPADNLVLTTVGDISLTATATADAASIQKVEFFQNSISLGAGTPASAGSYSLTWMNVPGGTYAITAQATDGNGLVSSSIPVTVFVKTPVVAGVRNAANPAATQPVAPGSLVSIFGTDFSDSAAGAESALLPNELGGVSVTFNGIQAPVAFVSATQINAQVPWGALAAGASSGNATVVVKRAPNASAPITIPLSAASPGIFILPDNQGAVLIASEGMIAAPLNKYPGSRPVRRGEYIAIFCTGLGQVDHPQTSGTPAPSDPLAQLPTLPSIAFQCNGRPDVFCGRPSTRDDIPYAGLAPGFVGLYQINVRVYADADTGDAVPMRVFIGATVSNTVTIAIAP